MPFLRQVQDVQKDTAIRKICGVRTDSPDFFALLNEVEKALMIRGGWLDLEPRVNFCISGTRIVWPEFVGTVLAVRFWDGVGMSRNSWYSFTPHPGLNHGRGFRNGFGYRHDFGGDVIIEDDNSRPCYRDISPATGCQIRYYVVNGNDVGKKCTIYGRKYGGQPLQERVDGVFQNGLTLVAANPYSETTDLVTDIQSVVREPTEGMAYLYEYDPVCNQLRDIASFRPGETHPRYRASRILNVPRRTPDSFGCCWTHIEAKIKLQFVELTNERDFIPVDNLRAVKLGIQAIKLEEANNDSAAAEKWALAIHEMNMESFDRNPDDQLTIVNNTFGDTDIGRSRLW